MPELTNDEVREILSDIARKGSPSVSIQAVRMLTRMRGEAGEADETERLFAELEELDVHRRRSKGRPKPKVS
jgi:hypothetical protein